MGFLDKMKGRARTAVDQHGDKIAQGIDKAADVADRKTKGKYSGQIRQGQGKSRDALDRLDGEDDNDLGGPGGPRPR